MAESTYETLPSRARLPRTVKEALATGWEVLAREEMVNSEDESSETGVTILVNKQDGRWYELHLEVPYRASYRFGRPRRITLKAQAKR
jgi:hypothetical protein